MRLRAVSPLLATIVLIAIVVSVGIVAYGVISGWMGIYSSTLSVQPVSADLVVAGGKALLSVSVKNAGNKPLAGIVVTGYDDNGKPFKLALPPADPGQASGNALVIPLGVPNIALDGSGNNNHGTIHGATWTDGKHGKALSFDGVDDLVVLQSVEPRLDGKDFTIAGWFKPSPLAKYQFLWWKWRPNVFITPWLDRFVFELDDGTYKPVAVLTPVMNKWYFLVQVHAGSLHKAYVCDENGLIGTAQRNDIGTTRGSDGYRFQISRPGWWSANNAYYQGLADEVRIYNRALNDWEVKWNYENPNMPIINGLVLWLKFTEGKGDTLHDYSGYNNHGTIYGATWGFEKNPKFSNSKLLEFKPKVIA